jgi:hypothetical protein
MSSKVSEGEREMDGVIKCNHILGKKTTKIECKKKSPNPWPASAIIASAEHGCSLLFFDFALVVAFLVVVVAEHEENCWRSVSSAFRPPRSIRYDFFSDAFKKGLPFLSLGSLFLCHVLSFLVRKRREKIYLSKEARVFVQRERRIFAPPLTLERYRRKGNSRRYYFLLLSFCRCCCSFRGGEQSVISL